MNQIPGEHTDNGFLRFHYLSQHQHGVERARAGFGARGASLAKVCLRNVPTPFLY